MQQTNIPIGTLVNMYKRGELRLPDSLHPGYTSGSGLMQETDAPTLTRCFAIDQLATARTGHKRTVDITFQANRLIRLPSCPAEEVRHTKH